MDRKILVNVVDPEECRVAVLEDGLLQEFALERARDRSTVGDIYKGRVLNVEPSIQAAFVDLGESRNGFLHASDCIPELHGRPGPRSRPPPVQDFLRGGEELLVQVTRDGIGRKGPTLTTYLSLPGRYVVLMPALARRGVSKKIEDEDERRRLREIVDSLPLPGDEGLILRTAAEGRCREEAEADLREVRASWEAMLGRAEGARAPVVVHRETDLVTRTLRDVFDDRVSEILVDCDGALERVRDTLERLRPGSGGIARRHTGSGALFEVHGVEAQVEEVTSRHVPLPSGGHLVIDRTEALVAIDVNSGSCTSEKGLEETAFLTDLEAVPEICRQIRLRDLGGVIILDLIDVRETGHRRKLERALREGLRRDRARIRVSRISDFGIVEMTRQRVGPGLEETLTEVCPTCDGSGRVPRRRE
jgi:ribonuclease E